MLIVLMSVTTECEWLDSFRLLPVVNDEELEVPFWSNCRLVEGRGEAEEEEEEEEEEEDEGFLRLR